MIHVPDFTALYFNKESERYDTLVIITYIVAIPTSILDCHILLATTLPSCTEQIYHS